MWFDMIWWFGTCFFGVAKNHQPVMVFLARNSSSSKKTIGAWWFLPMISDNHPTIRWSWATDGWTGHGFPSWGREGVKSPWSHEHSIKLAARYPMKSPNFCWSNESHPHENLMKSSCLLVKFYWITLNLSQIHENERLKDRELWGFSVAGEIVGEPYWVGGVVLAPGWGSAAIMGIHVGLVIPHPPQSQKTNKIW